MPGQKRSMRRERTERERALDEIEKALAVARGRLKWGMVLRGVANSLYMPLLGAGTWVLAARFTALDLPLYPFMLSLFVWLAVFIVWATKLRISRGLCAQFLDRFLELDERVATCVELESRDKAQLLEEVPGNLRGKLLSDTAELLRQKSYLLPGSTSNKPKRARVAVTALAGAALIAMLLLPTSFDEVRAERNALRSITNAQAQKLAELRADIVARLDLSSQLKDSLAAELDALQKELQAPNQDRSEALALLAEAEERVRQLLPPVGASDMQALHSVAQLIQLSAADRVDPDFSFGDPNDDLGSAASELERIKTLLDKANNVQARAIAADMERAANQIADTNPELAQNLQNAANAIRNKDMNKASSSLQQAANQLKDAKQQQQVLQAVEGTLGKLEEGRQSIAQAGGIPNAKRGQVGFRRGNPETAQGGSTPLATPAAPNGDTAGLSGNNGLRIGQNQPAFGLSNGAGSSPGQAGQGSNGSQNTAGGQGSGQSNGGQVSGGSSGGAGSNAGGPSSGIQGPIQGPIQVSGNQALGADNAQGNGVAGSAIQGGTQGAEQVYIPNTAPGSKVGVAGQAAPQSPNADGIGGRSGEGATGDAKVGGPGLGAITTVHTPYTEVIGKYTQQATEALDRAYVPPDAKEYVRQYFTALGK